MTTNVPPVQFTLTGLVLPQEADVLAGVQADIDAAFGGGLDPGLSTPQGQLASSEAAIIGAGNDLFAQYVNQVDPAYAAGRMQDAIGKIYFIDRKPAQPTAAQCTCVGLNGTPIPTGSQAPKPPRPATSTCARPAAPSGSAARSRCRSPPWCLDPPPARPTPSRRSTRPCRAGTRSTTRPTACPARSWSRGARLRVPPAAVGRAQRQGLAPVHLRRGVQPAERTRLLRHRECVGRRGRHRPHELPARAALALCGGGGRRAAGHRHGDMDQEVARLQLQRQHHRDRLRHQLLGAAAVLHREIREPNPDRHLVRGSDIQQPEPAVEHRHAGEERHPLGVRWRRRRTPRADRRHAQREPLLRGRWWRSRRTWRSTRSCSATPPPRRPCSRWG